MLDRVNGSAETRYRGRSAKPAAKKRKQMTEGFFSRRNKKSKTVIRASAIATRTAGVTPYGTASRGSSHILSQAEYEP